MSKKSGYKQSLVMKQGIKVTPVTAVKRRGTFTEWFHIKVTKISSKTGREVEVIQKDPKIYYYKDHTVTKQDKKGKSYKVTEPSVWKKIDEIWDYYYNKLTKNKDEAFQT